MKNVVNDIRTRLKDAAVKAFGTDMQAVEPTVDNASNPAFGDFQSNLALTLSKQLKQQPRAIAEQIVSDAHDASDVIRRIRALFKQAAPEKTNLDVNRLILRVCALMSDEIHVDGIWIKTELAEDVPMINADAVQIQQVMVNLLRNAIEASAMTTERSQPLLLRSRLDGGGVVVDVQDRGIGLADCKAIFEPFVTTKETGMGMGLAICQSIIEAHGGRIWVVRNEAQGVTFSFSLPIDIDVSDVA